MHTKWREKQKRNLSHVYRRLR